MQIHWPCQRFRDSKPEHEAKNPRFFSPPRLQNHCPCQWIRMSPGKPTVFAVITLAIASVMQPVVESTRTISIVKMKTLYVSGGVRRWSMNINSFWAHRVSMELLAGLCMYLTTYVSGSFGVLNGPSRVCLTVPQTPEDFGEHIRNVLNKNTDHHDLHAA